MEAAKGYNYTQTIPDRGKPFVPLSAADLHATQPAGALAVLQPGTG